MVGQGRKHDLEELLAGTRWVRGLARSLVSDPAGADDVAQEAWVVALSRRAAARDPGAWLAGVVKRLAWRQARSAERAHRREAAVARPDHVPSTDELVERSELQEQLSSAVRALDEPYRTTVLLHYSEGLSLEEIACTQGMPASTVRTRLARALERLRRRLDHEHGDRAAWMAALVPLAGAPALPSLAATTSVAVGSLTMGAKTGLGIAAIAAGIAVLGVTLALREEDHGVSAPATQRTTAEIAANPVSSASTDIETARVEGRESVEATPLAAASRGPLLAYGSLRSSDGEPVAGANVLLWNDQGETKSATVARESWSIVLFEPGAWNVDVTAEGYYPLRSEFTVSSSAPETRHDLALEKARSLLIRFVDAEGKPIVAASPLDPLATGLGVVATSEPPGPRVAGVQQGSWRRGDAGHYVYARPFQSVEGLPPGCAGRLTLTRPPPVYVSAVLADRVLETRLDSGAGDEMTFAIDVKAQKASLASLALRAVDSRSGEPLEGHVRMGMRAPGARMEQGVAVFEGLLPGMHELSIETPDHERYHRTLRLEPGQALDLGDVPLDRGRSLKGRVVGEDGKEVVASLSFIASELVRGPLDLDDSIGWSGGAEFDFGRVGDGEPWLFVSHDDYAVNPLPIETDEQGFVTAVARKGTPVLLRPSKGAIPGQSYAITDSSGRPFWMRGVWGEVPMRLRLVPGRYQLLEGLDDDFKLVRTLDVGAEPVVIEP
jgi:RNA polymerase sigma-70 factor (ECF subfamily)